MPAFFFSTLIPTRYTPNLNTPTSLTHIVFLLSSRKTACCCWFTVVTTGRPYTSTLLSRSVVIIHECSARVKFFFDSIWQYILVCIYINSGRAKVFKKYSIYRQTERSSVGATPSWGAHPPGFKPGRLHAGARPLCGAFQAASGGTGWPLCGLA